MKSAELKNIKKFYFGYEDISRSLGISAASAKVAASRYVKQGILLRMKKNMYLLKEEWKVAGREDKFLLRPQFLDLLNVKYILWTPRDPAFQVFLGHYMQNGRLQEVFDDGRVKIFDNSRAMPRAWLVDRYEVVDSTGFFDESAELLEFFLHDTVIVFSSGVARDDSPVAAGGLGSS